jgi:pSer/pThr/pTyr-binding forkhead associated (FHA) protein
MSDPTSGSGQGERPEGTQQPPDAAAVTRAGGTADTTVSLGAVTPAEPTEAHEAGLSTADLAAVEALPSGSALLVVQRGPNAGARFLLDAERTSAGRRPDSDIFLDDVTVSRRHAEFLRRGGGFVVRDIGSLNGTYVQRDRIEEVQLRPGDEVQIGKYRMVFHPSPKDSGSAGG